MRLGPIVPSTADRAAPARGTRCGTTGGATAARWSPSRPYHLYVLDVVVELVGESLLSLAGPAARTVRSRHRERQAGRRQPIWDYSTVSAGASAAVSRALARAEIRQQDTIAVAEFLRTAEGALLARYVAIDVVTSGAARVGSGLVRQAVALLRLCPSTRSLDAAAVAPELVRVLEISIRAMYTDMKRISPALAIGIRDVGMLQYKARVLGDLAGPNGDDLWDLSEYSPEAVLAEVGRYCALLADQFGTLAVPSLQEERRVPVKDIYVEPELWASVDTGPGRTAETRLAAALGAVGRWVVLGDPGAGKSTLLRSTTYYLARRFGSDPGAVVPVYVSLAKYSAARAAGVDFLSYVADALAAGLFVGVDRSALRYLLATGRVALFLDGLDEILRIAERAQVRDDIESLARRFPGAAIVVSSRSIGYGEAPLEASRFPSLHVGRFDDSRIEQFARAFFSYQPAGGPAGTEVLDRFLEDSKGIQDIRSNPLMLGLLCILYQNDRTIPVNRAELYRACAELLFAKWDSRRGIEPAVGDAEAAEDAVAEIALKVFNQDTDEIGDSWLRQQLEEFYLRERGSSPGGARTFAAEVLDLWRGRRWLLVSVGNRDGEEHFVFSHRTFMEYFAALQTAYQCSTVEAVWQALAGYVQTRSAVVYCQLAAQIFSRRTQGAGDGLLDLLVAETGQRTGRPRWNCAAFLSEIVVGVRASAAARERTCTVVADVVTELLPLSNDYPDAEAALNDVFTESDDDADDNFNFARVTLLLQNLAKAPSHLRDALLSAVAGRLSELLGRSGLVRAKAARLILEAPMLIHSDTWAALDPERADGFARWAVALAAETADEFRSGRRRLPTGRDFWLDIYLTRAALLQPAELVALRGPAALIPGGWGIPLIAPPQSGSCLHVLVHDAISGAAAGAPCPHPDAFAELAETTLRFVHAAPVDLELFSAVPGGWARSFSGLTALDLAGQPRDFQYGLACALLALAHLADYDYVDGLQKLAGDHAVRGLVTVLNATRYRGDHTAAEDYAVAEFGPTRAAALLG
jgi:NACHT domain